MLKISSLFIYMKSTLSFFLVAASFTALYAEDLVTVTVEPTTIRNIGGVTKFQREQYITMHSGPDEIEYTDEDLVYLEDELEISYGRDGGTRSLWRSKTPEDPKRPGFADLDKMREFCAQNKEKMKGNRRFREASTRETIITTHPQLFYAKPDQKGAAWGPKTNEAAAEFDAHFTKEFWDDAGRPKYFEVFNEPFVHAEEIGATIPGYCEQHNVVAKKMKELCPDVLVGGYTAAWPELEERDFEHWNNWQKTFMDLSGEHMDFFSTHIYDGVNVTGDPVNRTGSNSEAILDMIDAYSFIKWGKAKPQVISEYGLIPNAKGEKAKGYSKQRDALMLRSFNGMLSTFMDHPDILIKTVPFIIGKAEWTYVDKIATPENPWPFVMWRKVDGAFVKTELPMFYQFWKGVKGEWRKSASSDPDVRTHVLQDGKRMHVILTNLEEEIRVVDLKGLESIAAEKISIRSMTTHGDAPMLTQKDVSEMPKQLTLQVGENVMLQIDTKEPLATTKTQREYRCFATTYLQEIKANEPVNFTFEKVPTGKGSAVLRLSIGRKQGASLQPSVKVNGKDYMIAKDWSGYDQAGRKSFFGVIEVPIASLEDLKKTNSVELTFPDDGGKVAAAVLQVNREE